jgi:ATP-binding cassette subfamily C (CFTR/MRP) protein 4
MRTDDLIQKIIRERFSHSTVLTIAHRLNTVADYDKIMLVSAGKVVEFDTPINLLC